MHKHPIQTFLRSATVSFLIAGIAVLVSASNEFISASGTGQGGDVIPRISAVSTLRPTTLHAAALLPPAHRTAAKQLAIGSLLILVGFFFHALLVIRSERPVRVNDVTGKKKKPGNVRVRTEEWFFIRM